MTLPAYLRGTLLSQVCLRALGMIRLGCRLLGVGLSVASGSWIGLVPC
jgi:hypothetical protein